MALLVLLSVGAAAAAGDGTVLNPHTREACLHCHKGGAPGPAGRTAILPSGDEASRRRRGQLPLLSQGASRTSGSSSSPPLPGAPPRARPGSPRQPPRQRRRQRRRQQRRTPPPLDSAAAAVGGGEGFENSHDAMDCAGCHDKPAAELKAGSATPARFTSQGVEVFCRSCHAAVDRSHYPRGNVPLAGTTCLNCHRAHGRSLLFPSLRDDFPKFLADSANLNPHGGKIFCLACHPDTPQQGAPVVLRFPGESLRLCQRCHPGVEHHPLGVKSTPATWKMDFSRTPLEKEAIVCISCHKPPECLGATGRENPRFLRGGPYNTSRGVLRALPRGEEFLHAQPARPDRRERRDLPEEVPVLPRRRAERRRRRRRSALHRHPDGAVHLLSPDRPAPQRHRPPQAAAEA